ncbi:MAG: hypothetical protein APF76_17930 [Desulfitibacter sp. BRH_c19]|nr:MAG: hypothetical protein APF76_17930 [Desulfitibacter sp. BRH_c19]
MNIKVLGSGCMKCNKLEELVKEVVGEMGVDAKIEKITDIKEIAKTGILMTPGLVIDNEVKASGKLPSKAEVTQMITSVLAK